MEISSSGPLVEENSQLNTKNERLRKHVEDPREQMIIDQRNVNERMEKLITALAP